MTKKTIKIGTRGSNLAMFQAVKVKEAVEKVFPDLFVELKVIKTKGDKILDVALSKIGDKGLFTKELEIALMKGEIDMAVHSLKDMPTELPEGLKLGAVIERGDIRDALVSKHNKKLAELTQYDRIATSSLRRKAGLLHYNNNLNFIDIRGNVASRLKKMEDGHCDAMIMAVTGLERLGLSNHITEIIEPEVLIPAVSQGAIGIESRKTDDLLDHVMAEIKHEPTWLAIIGERAFMRTLHGGCQVPVGCYSKLDNEKITMKGFICSIDGKNYIPGEITGSINETEMLGIKLAECLLEKGGAEILKQIRII